MKKKSRLWRLLLISLVILMAVSISCGPTPSEGEVTPAPPSEEEAPPPSPPEEEVITPSEGDYTLTVRCMPEHVGSVDGNIFYGGEEGYSDYIINTGATFGNTAKFEKDQVVYLVPKRESSGYRFIGWGGDVAGLEDYEDNVIDRPRVFDGAVYLKMDGNKEIVAIFAGIDEYAEMTGEPAFSPSSIPGNGETVTVSIPVTTSTITVAIRLYAPSEDIMGRTIVAMTYADVEYGADSVNIETPWIYANPGKLFLEVYVYGPAELDTSLYEYDPKWPYRYRLTQGEQYVSEEGYFGLLDEQEGLCDISIAWLTITGQ